VARDDLSDRGHELDAGRRCQHDAVDLALAGGDGQHLVECVREHDDPQARRGGPNVVEHDDRPGDRVEARIEEQDVGLGLRQVFDQYRRVAGGTRYQHAEVVQQPAKRLGHQLVLVGDHHAHAGVYLPHRLQSLMMVAHARGPAW